MLETTLTPESAVPAGPLQAPVLGGGLPFLGHLPALRRDPIAVFKRAMALDADMVRIPVGPADLYLIRRPEQVKYVLQENQRNFSKQTRGYDALRLVLGNGLVTSEGDFWLRQRRLAQPAFHRQRIGQFAKTMVSLAGEMLADWEVRRTRGERVVDVAHEMMQVTLRVVGWTLLSTEVGGDTNVVSRNLTDILHELIRRTTALWTPPLSVPTRQNRIILRSRRALDQVVLRIIEERRRGATTGDDLLGMLMAAQDEDTGERMTNAQLRDEVMTIFLAGHETTANALTWTLYLLSEHPHLRERLEEEVDQVLGDRPPSLADLPRLTFTLAVIQEAMRLYPPVWVLMRRAERDDVIGGYAVPQHGFVAIAPYILHRDPALFPNPDRFDPDRFLGERAASIPRFGYIPFSTGPRICIGNNFALMEAQLIVASITQRYRLDLVDGHPVELDPAITLRPLHGMKMVLERRGEA